MDATKSSLEWMVKSRECNSRPLSGSEIEGLKSTLQLLAEQAGPPGFDYEPSYFVVPEPSDVRFVFPLNPSE
jgi:hypothetical protein